MFKELALKLFLESQVYEDDEPLDFGPVGPDKVVDTLPEPQKSSPAAPTFNFLGQPVSSELVAKELRGYMGNIRKMLTSLFFSSLEGKDIQKSMRQYIRNTIMSRRNAAIAPNVNQELFKGNKPEKFEAFLQEWLYVQYGRLLEMKRKEPSIDWSSRKIDLKDEAYVNELLGGRFWENLKSKIFQSEQAGDVYKAFSTMVTKEKERRAKERERGATRRAAADQNLSAVAEAFLRASVND